MADYAVTAASVLKGANATTATGTAGATITAGQPLYIDTSDSDKLKLADADASLLASTVAGVALHGAASGQPITYVTDDDDFTHGLTGVSTADIIILSSVAGAVCPASDLSAGEFPQLVMIAKSSTKAVLKLAAGGVAKA
jgi:hypothetical protein